MKISAVKQGDFFNRIQSYFSMIIMMILLYTLFISIFYFNMLRNEATDRYAFELNEISDFIDTSIHEIIQNVSVIEYNEHLISVLYSASEIDTEDYFKVYRSYNFVNRLRASKDFINNVYILHKPNSLVITSDGSSNIHEYYGVNGVYEKYDDEFFLNFESASREVEILEATGVKRFSSEKVIEVIPMAICKVDGHKLQNLIFVDLKKSGITNLFSNYQATPNSYMFIYDNKYNYVIEQENTVSSIFEKDMISEIIGNKSNEFYFFSKGKIYMAIKQSKDITFDQYEYIAIVPVVEFFLISLEKFALPSITILVSLTLILFLFYYFSKRITYPIGKLIAMLKENSLYDVEQFEKRNEIEYINYKINKVISDNIKLTDEISNAMPYVYERYLISILNNNSYLTKNEISRIVNSHDFNFEHNYFCAILTSIHFSEVFYEKYSNDDYRRIFENILLAQKNIFPKTYISYVLSIGKNQICIVLNCEYEHIIEDVVSYTNEFYQNFGLEESLITIETGVGNISKDLRGLHKSYQEALKALAISLPKNEKRKVKSFKEVDGLCSIDYTLKDENKLLNLLIKGDKEGSLSYFKEIMGKNLIEDLPDTIIKELYMYIYNTGLRVFNILNVTPYDLMADDYINIIANATDLSMAEFHDYMNLFLSKLVDYAHKSRSYRIDTEELKNYLEKNYTEELYLDKIAMDFNINSTNISKMIKNALGMSFQKYISRLRINKAKDILKNSNKCIEIIAGETGYNSRHTFIRMFKQLEGITPSEYRKLYSLN